MPVPRFVSSTPPQKPSCVCALCSAHACLTCNASTDRVGGFELSGMSSTVVTPPAAAARVAQSKPSHSVRPGSLICTCVSTMPGISVSSSCRVIVSCAAGAVVSPGASVAPVPCPACRPGATEVIMPSSTSTVPNTVAPPTSMWPVIARSWMFPLISRLHRQHDVGAQRGRVGCAARGHRLAQSRRDVLDRVRERVGSIRHVVLAHRLERAVADAALATHV